MFRKSRVLDSIHAPRQHYKPPLEMHDFFQERRVTQSSFGKPNGGGPNSSGYDNKN